MAPCVQTTSSVSISRVGWMSTRPLSESKRERQSWLAVVLSAPRGTLTAPRKTTRPLPAMALRCSWSLMQSGTACNVDECTSLSCESEASARPRSDARAPPPLRFTR